MTNLGAVRHTLTLEIRPGRSPMAGFDWDATCACGTRWARIGWTRTLSGATTEACECWEAHAATAATL